MTFLSPVALLLFLPALLLAGWAARTRRPVAVRLLGVSCFVLAAAQPVLFRGTQPETVMIVVDTSESIPLAAQQRALAAALAQARALPRVGIRTLDPQQPWRLLPGRPIPDSLDTTSAFAAHTALAAAMQGALRLLPPGQPGRLVVMTDGRSTDDLSIPLGWAAGAGVAVEVVALDPGRPAPGLGPLTLTVESAAPGETLAATLVVHGGDTGLTDIIQVDVSPTAASGGDPVLSVPIEVEARRRAEVALEIPLPASVEAGPAWITARLQAQAAAPIATRGASVAGVVVRRPPRVLLVGAAGPDTRAVQAALAAEGMAVEQRGAAQPGAVEGFSLVLLVNTPTAGPGALPARFVASLAPFVSAGGGLVVVGGERAYDLGGWQDSPLADLLPVEIDPDGALKEDGVTLLLVLDKSGSMAEPADFGANVGQLIGSVSSRMNGGSAGSSNPTGSKMRLANEGAIAALSLLRDADQLGVLAVDTLPMWAVPLQKVSADRSGLAQRIAQTRGSGGGIALMTALLQAQQVMQTVDSPLRHIILFVDVSDVGEQERAGETALELVADLRRDQITLSVIGIGAENGRDASFLKELAQRGGGRIHLTADAQTLPALFAQETERLLGAGLREAPDLRVRQERWHPALQGIRLESAPPLRGMNAVKRRARARVLLAEAQTGAPVLALWNHGLGEVAAFTTDAGARWSSRWLRWDGYARLWTQLARALTATLSADTDSAFSLSTQGATARARLTLRRADGLSEDVPGLTFLLQSLPAPDDPALPPRPPDAVLHPRVVEPGIWEAEFPTDPGQPWRLLAQNGAGQTLTSRDWIAPPSAEHAWRTPDPDALRRLQQPITATLPAPPPSPHATWPLAPGLLTLGALLLPFDAFRRQRRRLIPRP